MAKMFLGSRLNDTTSKSFRAAILLRERIMQLTSQRTPTESCDSDDVEPLSEILQPDGPSKPSDEEQCVISPPPMGNLSMYRRTDDVCVAAIAHYLKAETDMLDEKIRKIMSIVTDPMIWNKNCVRKVRTLLTAEGDGENLNVKHSLTYFIMNTVDPAASASQSIFDTESSRPEGKRHSLAPNRRNRSASTMMPKGMGIGKRVSGVQRQSWKMSSSVALRETLAQRASQKETLAKTVADRVGPVVLRGKIGDKSRVLRMGNLEVSIREGDLEDYRIECRTSDSVVEHALKLKAESIEVAEGSFLLRSLADMPRYDIFEANRKWENEFIEHAESDESIKGKKLRKKTSFIKTGLGKTKSKKSDSNKTSVSSSSISSGFRRALEDRDDVPEGSLTSSTKGSGHEIRKTPRIAVDGVEKRGFDENESSSDGSYSDGEHSSLHSKTSRDNLRSGSRRASDTDHHIKSGHRDPSSDRSKDRSRDRSKGRGGKRATEYTNAPESKKVKSKAASRAEIDETLVGGETQCLLETRLQMGLKKKQRPKSFSDMPPTPLALDQGPEVKKYLEAKGIHHIFESLMVSLLTDLPSQPLDYLIDLTGHMNRPGGIDREIGEKKEKEMLSLSGSTRSSNGGSYKTMSSCDIGSSLSTLAKAKDALPPVDA